MESAYRVDIGFVALLRRKQIGAVAGQNIPLINAQMTDNPSYLALAAECQMLPGATNTKQRKPKNESSA